MHAPGGPRRLGRLTRRAEFQALTASKRKSSQPGVMLQVRAHDERQRPAPGTPVVRVGFTASKKVGGAVERNRARRRLRAAAAEVLATQAAPDTDYVLVARSESVRRPFALLKADLTAALRKVGAFREPEPGAP